MIDETRAPATAEWARKNAKLMRDNPKLREIAEALAVMEAEALDVKAKATIGVKALERLEKALPTDAQRMIMTPVDMRKMLADARTEVDESLQAIREIR